MKKIRSFDPVASRKSRIVVLGTMPGQRSIEAAQYYAHPRNVFWKIMQEAVGLNAEASYNDRTRALKSHGVALWDVLHSCHRKGSLDAAIRKGSVKVNDFNTFFQQNPKIDTVLFNGGAAERYYKKYVLPGLERETINHLRMPSTSPAHAAVSFKQKVAAWRKGMRAQQTAARDRVKKRGA